MRTLTVRVKDGRIKMDEPSDMPEGAEVDVLVIDDDLGSEERAELHASLDCALGDSDAGRGVDAWQYINRRPLGDPDRN